MCRYNPVILFGLLSISLVCQSPRSLNSYLTQQAILVKPSQHLELNQTNNIPTNLSERGSGRKDEKNVPSLPPEITFISDDHIS
jgi:hypothetical protein